MNLGKKMVKIRTLKKKPLREWNLYNCHTLIEFISKAIFKIKEKSQTLIYKDKIKKILYLIG